MEPHLPAFRATVLALGLCVCTVSAQQASQATIDELLARIKAAEAQIKELQARLEGQSHAAAQAPSAPVVEPPSAPPPPAPVAVADSDHHHGGGGLMTSGLQMRGFGDIQYMAGDHGTRSTFAVGQFDLFMTSKLSENWSFLAESVVQADSPGNQFGFEIERLQLTYSPKDYFNLTFGRYHQTIGYYNTAYHHGTWFQTAVGRPFIFAFEDEGGLLPIHNVGMAVFGRIPGSKLNLQYSVEIGNGRTSHSPDSEYVQNVFDENNRKSVNIALSARPSWVPGMEVGASFLKDRLSPDNQPRVGQTVSAAYAVYRRNKVEFLNEFIYIRDSTAVGVLRTPGWYTQLSRGWHSLRPYVRYEYVNANRNDPMFGSVGRRSGPKAGLRWDAGEFSAFKVEYGRLVRTGLPDTNTLVAQVAFAF